MSWETSDRRDRLPPDWKKRVARIWERDKGQCRWRLPSGARCPRKGADVDHIVNNDDHSEANLRLLCRHHHDKKTAWEAVAGRARRRTGGKKRRTEAQPGGLP